MTQIDSDGNCHMDRELTRSEKILLDHGQTGFERPDGSLCVLELWTEPHRPGLQKRWRNLHQRELMGWLGY